MFGFSDGGTTVWRVVRGPNRSNYDQAVTGDRKYDPAYIAVIDMCRRWFIPIPILDVLGEPPNRADERTTSSSLNETLAEQDTVVENYRNLGFEGAREKPTSAKYLLAGEWKGFKLKGVGNDYPVKNKWHATILEAVRAKVVKRAVAAYKQVKP